MTQKLSLNKLSIHPSDTLTKMYTQQTAYIKTQSLWVKAYGLDSYPITNQTIYFALQYWNHSGCLSLLPNSPTAFFCCNWKEFSKHSRWQVSCSVMHKRALWSLDDAEAARAAVPYLQSSHVMQIPVCKHSSDSLSLYSQAIQGQTEACKKTPQIYFTSGCSCFTG